MMERVVESRPDLICLTEAYEGSTAPLGGHEIADLGAAWSNSRHDGESLALLWSPNPWDEVDAVGNDGTATGGYISGITDTHAGPMRRADIRDRRTDD